MLSVMVETVASRVVVSRETPVLVEKSSATARVNCLAKLVRMSAVIRRHPSGIVGETGAGTLTGVDGGGGR